MTIWQWSAQRAVAALAKGDVSPAEMLEAAEARIRAVEPKINALPTLCFDRARARIGALTPRDQAPPGYLHGLPVAIKDLTDVAGVRTTYGSPIFTDHVPAASDILVERLEAAGALVVAKSNTPEFGAGAQTFNEVFGTTTNPWNTALTCGGSSGGAAAALAAGEVALATGSDLGGSLRIPASFCSVVGLRPTPGMVPNGPSKLPFNTLSVEGPMARNVGDLALLLDIMAGRDARDPLSRPKPVASFVAALADDIGAPRVAFSPDLGITAVDPEVAAICEAAAKRLPGRLAAACPDLHDAETIFQPLRAAFFAAAHHDTLAKYRDKLKPEVIWNIEKGMALTAGEIGVAERARAALYHRVAAFFADYDCLACPTVLSPAFDHRLRYLESINGVNFPTYVSWLIMTFALTITGCPSISVPAGFTRDGRPVGLQLTMPPFQEARLLALAARLEGELNLVNRLPDL